MMGDYPEQEYTGSVIGRAALAGFAFFVAIMAGMYWFFTTSTYQFCSSAIGALNSRCAVEASTHNASGWVTLMAIAAGRSSRAACWRGEVQRSAWLASRPRAPGSSPVAPASLSPSASDGSRDCRAAGIHTGWVPRAAAD
jgi:hypothetical protein